MSESPPTAAPVCYRHPARETWVRCTRCERPICPDCMREASVGHQCPECVAEGRRTQRPARTAFGGGVAGQLGYVTKTLIALNVIVMIGVDRLGPGRRRGVRRRLGRAARRRHPLTDWGSVTRRRRATAAPPEVARHRRRRVLPALHRDVPALRDPAPRAEHVGAVDARPQPGGRARPAALRRPVPARRARRQRPGLPLASARRPRRPAPPRRSSACSRRSSSSSAGWAGTPRRSSRSWSSTWSSPSPSRASPGRATSAAWSPAGWWPRSWRTRRGPTGTSSRRSAAGGAGRR